VVAGSEWWPNKVRHFEIPTNRVEINGKKKPYISVATEAFGVLMMDNCHDKWLHEYAWKKDDPKRKIPTKGPEYAKFKAKYSDSKCGQISFGGWDPKGFDAYVGYMEQIKATRKADAGNNKVQQKFARDLVRNHHGIEDTEPRSSKRKKKPASAAPIAKKLRRIVESDDEDDE
jgi:hypothetical protein